MVERDCLFWFDNKPLVIKMCMSLKLDKFLDSSLVQDRQTDNA